jgi:hypothetical protein
MSFILDALKKLEHKRQQESVPHLMTVHSTEPQETKKRPIMPYIVAAALILNAGILLALLRPWDKQGPAPVTSDSVQPETISTVQPSKENTVDTLTPPTSPQIMKAAGVQINPPVETVTSETEKTEVKQSAAAVSNPPQAAPTESANNDMPKQTPADDTLASLKISPTDEELEVLRSKIKEEQLSSVNSVPDELRPAENEEIRSRSDVPELSQLPSSIRQGLPEIKINGHVFSDNPSSRIANINGSILREGDTVTRGLKVKEITMTGIIFDYDGVRFRMRAF